MRDYLRRPVRALGGREVSLSCARRSKCLVSTIFKHEILNAVLIVGLSTRSCCGNMVTRGSSTVCGSVRRVRRDGLYGDLFHFNDDFHMRTNSVMVSDLEVWSIEHHFDRQFSDVVNPEGVDSDSAAPMP